MMLRFFSNTTGFYIRIFLVLTAPFIWVLIGYAGNITAEIKIIGENRVSVAGQFRDRDAAFRNFSFTDEYADAVNLAARIENFRAFDGGKKEIETKKISSSIYQTAAAAVFWEYEVNLKPSEKITDAAHASWLTKDYGILMLADLLPQTGDGKTASQAIVEFVLPKDFKIYLQNSSPLSETLSTSGSSGENFWKSGRYDITDAENTVFLVGRGVREKTFGFSGESENVAVTIAGNWQFSDDEAAEMTRTIIEEYKKIFTRMPKPFSRIIIAPFPQENVNSDRWRAETRGSTATIISGQIPLKSVAVQRLHEQLRHETFHFWIPNALDLSGNYDWFYEGFTLYRALKTGVELNQIRFEDFLRTVSRAYDISQELSETQTFSLIDASNKRWAGSNTFIYAKGLTAAFLCDIALLRESRGRRDLNEVFRQVYEKHRFGNSRIDGNTAVLNILKNYPELVPLVQKYVEGNLMFSVNDYFESAGLEFEPKPQKNSPSKLIVKAKLGGRQKDLLDKLGYNQWRKLLRNK